MASAKPHRNLLAWKVAVELVVVVYEYTGTFPKEEAFGLTSQMRRAAVSVPSNLAEGAANRETDHFRNHVRIAIGSLNELETQLELSARLGFGSSVGRAKAVALADRCLALTCGLRKKLDS